jgi:MYXO-CTERM domain-containing protein
MEWQAWRQKAAGELYYDTTYAYTKGDAWTSQYYFGGNGDGTLFYPGTPAKIGGTSHIPLASLRVKLIREGMEDYEYLKALSDAGDPAMADAEAAALSPKAYQNVSDAAQIDAARHRIALRIEQLTGQTPPPMGGTGAGAGSGDQNGGSGGSGDGTGIGGNGATTGDTGSDAMPTTPATPSSHSGCSLAPGHSAGVTPFTLAFGIVALLLVARRRRRAQAVRVRR